MKKTIQITFVVLVILATVLFIFYKWTKSYSPSEKVELTSGGLTVTVEYCRPYMKNRKIFGELVPYGVVWRTGANEATLISFSKNVTLGGKRLKAGKYSLWTIPGKEEWAVIINRETGQWGTNYNEKEDILRVNVPSQKLGQTVDQLTLQLRSEGEGADLVLNWENTGITVPVR